MFLFHSPGFWNTQEDASQPGPCEVVPLLSPKTGEKSSASEYFSCATSAGKLLAANEDGKEDIKVGSELGQEVQCASQPNPYLFYFILKNRKGLQAEGLGLKPL